MYIHVYVHRSAQTEIHTLYPGETVFYTWERPHDRRVLRWGLVGVKIKEAKPIYVNKVYTHCNVTRVCIEYANALLQRNALQRSSFIWPPCASSSNNSIWCSGIDAGVEVPGSIPARATFSTHFLSSLIIHEVYI